MNKKGIRKSIIVSLIVVISIIFVVFIYFLNSQASLGDMLLCKFKYKGEYWSSNIIRGCFKKFSDAGKLCINGNECEARSCTIERYTKPNTQGKYQGVCPNGTLGALDEKYFPFCGEATIEDGKIIEDQRFCVY